MAKDDPISSRSEPALVAVAAVLAALMLLKFVVSKPIMFLLLAVLFGTAAFLVHRGRAPGRWLLLVLCVVTSIVFGAHLFDKGFDPGAYQNNADYILVLLGFPLAAVGAVMTALGIRGHTVTPDS